MCVDGWVCRINSRKREAYELLLYLQKDEGSQKAVWCKIMEQLRQCKALEQLIKE